MQSFFFHVWRGALALLGALSALALLPEWHWLLEVNRNLGAVYFVLAAISLALAPWWWQSFSYALRRVIVVFLLLNVVSSSRVIAPFLAHQRPAKHSEASRIEVLVLSCRQDVRHVALPAPQRAPDLVFLFGEESCSPDVRQSLHSKYHTNVRAQDAATVFMASSLELLNEPLLTVGELLRPAIIVRVKVRGTPLMLAAFSALPPFSNDALSDNRVQQRRISTIVRHSQHPVLVAAELHATPFSPYYQRFTFGSKLRDARAGEGLFTLLRSQLWPAPLHRTHLWYRGLEVLQGTGSYESQHGSPGAVFVLDGMR